MSRELQIVTGKGGTGKTTVASALAYGHALRGRRALVCEVDGRSALGDLFGTTLRAGHEALLVETPAGGAVHGLSVDARSALEEYLDKYFKLGLAGRALERFGVVEFATSIAPGLSDVLMTGKVYEAVRRRLQGLPNAYDVVVLDAPPTGRIARFLNVHESVTGLARVGPIHAQAKSVMEMFRSPTTVIHLTTLLEDMPVTETIEAVRDLEATGIALGSIVCSTTVEHLRGPGGLTADELALAARGELPLLGIDVELATPLRDGLRHDATAALAEEKHRAVLEATGLPLVELPHLPGGVDLRSLEHLADVLAPDLVEEDR